MAVTKSPASTPKVQIHYPFISVSDDMAKQCRNGPGILILMPVPDALQAVSELSKVSMTYPSDSLC